MFDLLAYLLKPGTVGAIKLKAVTRENLAATTHAMGEGVKRWVTTNGFDAKPGSFLALPDLAGNLREVLIGFDPHEEGFSLARLALNLPYGVYCWSSEQAPPPFFELAWVLESYSFNRYKKNQKTPSALVAYDLARWQETINMAEAITLVRDLINSPANACGPAELEKASRAVAEKFGAETHVISGHQLEQDFPLIHTVGQASPRAPRLIDVHWGDKSAPLVTLVGKGVCFDTGGLDLKSASNMALMKKDMGGAAHVLGLAHMIMAANLPLRLRVLIPAVENAVSGSAYRPGDVLESRSGLTVEIGNTDAEGRLVLADALTLADAEKPDLLIDMATLTGAARVALGPDLPAFFTRNEPLAASIVDACVAQQDPAWRLPLWEPYNRLFDSSIADINNSGEGGFAGAIIAALFLQRFVKNTENYVHFDVYGWQPTAKPGSPKGGEAQTLRALFYMLKTRYVKNA